LVRAADPGSSRIAPIQSTVVFCLQPETIGPFIEWLKRENPEFPADWFDPELIRTDLEAAALWFAMLIDKGL
jgi:hypothetical protein